MTKRKNALVKLVCTQCGSDDILVDAYARWDFDKQQYVLSTTCDECWCGQCDGPARSNLVLVQKPAKKKKEAADAIAK